MQTQYALHGNAGLRVDCLSGDGAALESRRSSSFSDGLSSVLLLSSICTRVSDQRVKENGEAQGQEHRCHQIGGHAGRIRINDGHRAATGIRSMAVDGRSRMQ